MNVLTGPEERIVSGLIAIELLQLLFLIGVTSVLVLVFLYKYPLIPMMLSIF